jgi:DNA invertase Pin-like site-specific DNA recombinase
MMSKQKRKGDSPRQAVLYLRAASADQRDQQLAIREQRALCTREAERLGAVIAAEFTDVGASGNNKSRGGLRRLLMAVRQRSIKYVIVRDHTRLTRNAADHWAIRRRLQRAGVRLVAVDRDAHSQVTVDEPLRSAQ